MFVRPHILYPRAFYINCQGKTTSKFNGSIRRIDTSYTIFSLFPLWIAVNYKIAFEVYIELMKVSTAKTLPAMENSKRVSWGTSDPRRGLPCGEASYGGKVIQVDRAFKYSCLWTCNFQLIIANTCSFLMYNPHLTKSPNHN